MDSVPFEVQYELVKTLKESELPANPITAECFQRVSRDHNIPEFVLKSILDIENGRPGQKVPNKNKSGEVVSWDVGPAQINTINLKHLYQKYNLSPIHIRFDGCTNIEAAAVHLRERIDRSAEIKNWQDMIQLIASYHSYTEEHNLRYANKLAKIMRGYMAKGKENGQ